jgi:hypothetical protein
MKNKKTTKKKTSSKLKKNGKLRGRRPYRKCIELVIKLAEDVADFGDCSDDLLDQIASTKKRLSEREQSVIGQLASGAFRPTIIEIDESSPGSELQIKV